MRNQYDPESLRELVADFPDFPKPGVVFRDISPLLNKPGALAGAAELMAKPFLDSSVTHVAGIESRGFLFGPLIAEQLNAGFCLIRKPEKLPGTTHAQNYGLEYGSDRLEIQSKALSRGDRVLIVDDVLATGGTLSAAEQLIHKTGADVVAAAVLIEIDFLAGRQQVGVRDVAAVIHY
tara:strand:+ start:1499 stop:2032 length:534 start_codon:yes stop_codon:yes gene_type:complete